MMNLNDAQKRREFSELFAIRSFGQEFYPHDAIRALKLADKLKAHDRATLTNKIAETLPQPGPATRRRIAEKFVQRYFISEENALQHGGAPGGPGLMDGNPTVSDDTRFQQTLLTDAIGSDTHAHAHDKTDGTGHDRGPGQKTARLHRQLAAEQPFVRLIARHRQISTQIELLYYRLARTDGVVGTLARELFYPIFVSDRPPGGFSRAEFAARNGGQLFTVAPLLTRSFILHYAQTRWSFYDRATLDRSLRVLQGAGLIARERMNDLRGHPTAFRMSAHDISPATFAYALYDEFLPHVNDANFVLRADVLPIADFTRTLLLSPAQVQNHCEVARQHQLLAQHGEHFRLTFSNLGSLVDSLLTRAI